MVPVGTGTCSNMKKSFIAICKTLALGDTKLLMLLLKCCLFCRSFEKYAKEFLFIRLRNSAHGESTPGPSSVHVVHKEKT